MSSPKSGRQSPPPEEQPGAQQQDPPGVGKAKEYTGGQSRAQEESERFKESGLTSNPVHPLEKHVTEMFEKGNKA
ncbi:hypothetical protein ASPZODRAFT_132728 [Penicilliopsis zonata CBS 506.65]|uniref:Uncharacterized protein n=1 Tax=Penicilliopsis zonata CBS 506.65 TaxID=1073090 RepID=A0A1L9SHG6_9EURO|nr:hypothetical protein ASPZODRAFT_132728 [Penicilliopsis zonata CBS 506.65]OJJ46628.1 hypothetical protein ASPZODRAFT_132728 [Penicilliopsis zonata CBS 506.65]